MEAHQILSVFMGNNKIIEELELKACNDSVTPNIIKKARNDLDDEKATNNS